MLLAALLALLFLAPAARSDPQDVTWSAPTPADRSSFDVTAGSQLILSLSASSTVAGAAVHIAGLGLPAGAALTSVDGPTARATVSWRPDRSGDYSLQFTATTVVDQVVTTAPVLTYSVHVKAKSARPSKPKVAYPLKYSLTDLKVAHWAAVLGRGVVRAQPTDRARAVTRLETRTTDDTQNIVLVLGGVDVKAHDTWYRIRLPILPNNSTGWVRARYVSTLFEVRTHLYVNTRTFRATLKRDGVTVFKTIVGVGKSVWPTPRGEFYVRDKLTGFGDPVYGPIAFGTSARSAVLTDWPGGGFVGVHGTNEPGILPGRVSHGCIRMPNASILKLARLMPVGTPLTVT